MLGNCDELNTSGDCFTNVSRALRGLAKVYSGGDRGCGGSLGVKLCTCAQGIALGTRARSHRKCVLCN